MTVYILGAGPGDPELLTIKAKKAIEDADVIIYAGSLINKKILNFANPKAEFHDSSSLTLDEIFNIIFEAIQKKKSVIRIHSGDPSIYGAAQELIQLLEGEGIPCEVIPGVSSFSAAAAALNKSYTLPGVSQTLILTRMGGRTKVPEKEGLGGLARHRASMCIFLSVHRLEEVIEELKKGYPGDTPVAVVYRASWEDERIVHGKLEDIDHRTKEIEKTALILVGDFLKGGGESSRLYNKEFGHGLRMRR